MKQVVDEVAKKFRDALAESIPDFEGLYVFGSQASGNATEDSDVDIVVIFGYERHRQPPAFYEILSKLMYDYYGIIDFDVHRRTRKQLECNPIFYDEVVNKGVWYDATAA